MKYGSRKFIIAFAQLPVMGLLPLVYKHYEISDSVTLAVLASVATGIASYTGFNVLEKHVMGKDE